MLKILPKYKILFVFAFIAGLYLFSAPVTRALDSSTSKIDLIPSGNVIVENAGKNFNSLTITTASSSAPPPQGLFISVSSDKSNWSERQLLKFNEELNSSKHNLDTAGTKSVSGRQYLSDLVVLAKPYKYLKIENTGYAYLSGLSVRLVDLDSGGVSYSSAANATYKVGSVDVISRSGWGCPDTDPNSNYYCDGPFWGTEYYPTTHITIHHTATANSSNNWANVVKAIWDYHAHSRDADPDDGVQGWTDIGYHYLIDPNGKIYEGRYGQQLAGENETVTAGHAQFHNRGNIGIAMIGTFSSTNITNAARSSLESLIQALIYEHNLNPYISATSFGGMTNTVISGHRNWASTECPGNTFYPTIKNMTFVPADSTLQPVFRFLNYQSKVHFYTASYAEKNTVTTQLAGAWKYENVAYFATRESGPEIKPVYRFLHRTLKVHFYTNSEWEKNFVQTKLGNIWQYEGIAFKTYATQVSGTKPVYRFLNKKLKVHFYTADLNEKNFVQENLANDWQYEFIAYYVK